MDNVRVTRGLPAGNKGVSSQQLRAIRLSREPMASMTFCPYLVGLHSRSIKAWQEMTLLNIFIMS